MSRAEDNTNRNRFSSQATVKLTDTQDREIDTISVALGQTRAGIIRGWIMEGMNDFKNTDYGRSFFTDRTDYAWSHLLDRGCELPSLHEHPYQEAKQNDDCKADENQVVADPSEKYLNLLGLSEGRHPNIFLVK